MKTTITRSLLLAVLLIQSFHAQSFAAISLENAIQSAEKNYPKIAQANSHWRETEEITSRRRAEMLPKVDLQSTLSVASIFGAVTATQNIYNGGRSSATLKLAKAEEDAANINRYLTLESVGTDVIKLYYQTLFLKSLLTLNQEILSFYEKAFGKAKKSKSLNVLGEQDYIKIVIDYNKIKHTTLDIQEEFNATLPQLRLLTGLSKLTAEDLSESLEIKNYLKFNKNQILNRMLEINPKVKIAEKQFEILDAQKEIAFSEDRMQVALTALGGVGTLNKNEAKKLGDSDFALGFNFGVKLTIPLFSGHSSHYKTYEFAEKRKQLDYALNLTQMEMKQEIETSLVHLNELKFKISSMEEQINLSKKLFIERLKYFKVGLITSDQITSSLTDYKNSFFDRLTYTRDYLILSKSMVHALNTQNKALE